MKEEWRDVVGYEGLYQVSSFGRVKSLYRLVPTSRGDGLRPVSSKVLKPSLTKSGYYFVNLCKNNKTKCFDIHKLVAISFLNHKPNQNSFVVDHIDGNRTNNKVENIQILSHRDNVSKGMLLKNKTSKYTGVTWNKRAGKWKAHVRNKGFLYHIGYFCCEETGSLFYLKSVKMINDGYSFIYGVNRKGLCKVDLQCS